MPETSIRLLLADDHPVVRAGLRHVLGTISGLSVVAEAESGEEALYLCAKHRPDIVIMDVKMAGIGGTSATRAICQTYHPGTRVLGLTTEADMTTVSQMIDAGASGLLLKTCTVNELETAIRDVLAGRIVLDPLLQKGAPRARTAAAESEITLGSQQKKVLALLVKGFTNSEIAERLGISLPTARYHVSAILVKLGASNRAEAAGLAVRLNIVGADDY
ncbi:response regulator transcription factor [Rhodopseudomonas palustris]|uniref:response regulator transcription factor n=1 Tax=Rhodopseudomonas palustris TaxID=1076 RepID=UPI002ACEB97A|nr:response regulator transcription factor [Rhodopseudomonas palustris]WQG97816.1 response regulator transcription factor [Rhodopseudomonas palustris]